MFCPHCNQQLGILRCPSCSGTYHLGDIGRLEQLACLRSSLESWCARGFFSKEATEAAIAEADQEAISIRVRLGLVRSSTSQPPLPATPTPTSTATSRAIPTTTKPPRKPIPWRKIGLSLVSERVLSALLLVGALLILASASVISTLNPTGLSPVWHFGAMLATTATFFLSGYVLRTRFTLLRTADALLAIGAVFLPLDIWTLAHDRLLLWGSSDVLVACSLVSLVAYFAIHVLVRTRTFALLTCGAALCTALTLAHRFDLNPQWWGCLLATLTVLFVLIASRLATALPNLRWALLSSGYILILGTLSIMTVLAGASAAGLTLVTGSAIALSVLWWLGTLFFILYAAETHHPYFTSVAGSSSAIASLLTLQALPVFGSWTTVAIAILACIYSLIGYLRGTRRSAIAPLRLWPYQVAAALSLIALLWPGATPLANVAATTLLIILYSVASGLGGPARREGSFCATVAVALLPLLLLYLGNVVHLPDPLLTWTLFGLAALIAAETTTQQGTDEQRVLWPWTLGGGSLHWPSPFTAPLFTLGYAVSGIVLVVTLFRYADTWIGSGLPVLQSPALVTMGLLLGALVASGIRRRRTLFLHIAAWSAITPVTQFAILCMGRLGIHESDATTVSGLILIGQAIVYLAAAALLDRDGKHGFSVLYIPGYALTVVAMLLTVSHRETFTWVLGFSIAAYAWSARQTARGRHHTFESWLTRLVPPAMRPSARALFGYLCAWLFPLWLLVQLSLSIPDLRAGSFGLALTILAAAYLAASLLVQSGSAEQRRPWVSTGIVLSIIGPLLTLNTPTTRLITLTLALILYTTATRISRRTEWAYGTALTFPTVALLWLIDYSGLQSAAYPLSCLPVLSILILAGDEIHRRGFGESWSRPFYLVGGAGVALTLAIIESLTLTAGSLTICIATALAYSAVLLAYTLWKSRLLSAWSTILFALVAIHGLLTLNGVSLGSSLLVWSSLGLLLCATEPLFRDSVWSQPLRWTRAALAACPLAFAIALAAMGDSTVAQRGVITVAIVGLQLITLGAHHRKRQAVYAGIALIDLAYLGQIALFHVTQIQFFVLPIAIYLLGVAYAEWRIAPRQKVKAVLENSALLLLIGTSLLQAFGIMADNAPAAFYDVIIIIEGLILLWLGNALHWKYTLTAGAVALGLDAVLIAMHPLRALSTWYIIAIAGIAIILFVITVEKKRQDITALMERWRLLYETWD